MQLSVNVIAENIVIVEGTDVPRATYTLDGDGSVRQFQRRRGHDCWVSVHSDRIAGAVRTALTKRERYQVTTNDGTVIWTGEADGPEDARHKASNVKRLVTLAP